MKTSKKRGDDVGIKCDLSKEMIEVGKRYKKHEKMTAIACGGGNEGDDLWLKD